jgi:hypothetical protein
MRFIVCSPTKRILRRGDLLCDLCLSAASALRYCTFALTVAFAVGVKRHVFALLPPLEHAPDQTASRPSDTDSVICVPLVNEALPPLPTATLRPDGLEVIRSPLRPEAQVSFLRTSGRSYRNFAGYGKRKRYVPGNAPCDRH